MTKESTGINAMLDTSFEHGSLAYDVLTDVGGLDFPLHADGVSSGVFRNTHLTHKLVNPFDLMQSHVSEVDATSASADDTLITVDFGTVVNADNEHGDDGDAQRSHEGAGDVKPPRRKRRKKHAEQKCSAVGCCEELKHTARNDGEHPLCEAHKRAPVARCTDGAEVCFCFYCNKAHGVEEFTYKTNICDRQYLRRREKAHNSTAGQAVEANTDTSKARSSVTGDTLQAGAAGDGSSPSKRGRKPKKVKMEKKMKAAAIPPKFRGRQGKLKVISGDGDGDVGETGEDTSWQRGEFMGKKLKLYIHATEAAEAVSGIIVRHEVGFPRKLNAVPKFKADDFTYDGSGSSGPRNASPRITLGMRVQAMASSFNS